MDKLKNKIFFTLISILTIFLLTILFIFNFQNYKNEENDVKRNLMMMDDNNLNPPNDGQKSDAPPSQEQKENQENNMSPNKGQNENAEPRMFADAIIYTVVIDNNKNIVDIISHSQFTDNTEEVRQLAQRIIENSETQEKIGNLYINKYSYSVKQNSIIIVDNTLAKEKLTKYLRNSIFIFVLLELIIVYISNILTKWITKPIEESLNKQKEFIADASHELKTPLAVIIANAEALENEPNEKKWLNNIQSEGKRMNDLISELLNMAEIENEKSEKNFKKENLSEIIEKSVLEFESLIYENGLKLDYKIDKYIYLNCNSSQIKQLVGILVDNAIKHCYKDGNINISLCKEKNNILFKVQNTGDEIPEEEREKIFERFYRGDKSRNRKDNRYGLGLAIAKSIVEKNSGKISAKSKNNLTTFTISFPVK